ncbi:MAG: guanylate kinase, partial [Lachnospiraceae bacterium]|nr:guanylate kinase [Lachnospiraceae bacterium]
MKQKGILIVVSGFSGAGKGTLMKQLVHTYDNYALSVSMTTRSPRPGEEEGKEYFFVSREAFEGKIAQDGLIEYASYCENYYGTPREYVEKQLERGKDVILEIEIQGALKIKKKFPTALLMFVMPPNAAELKRRLEGRGTESREIIEKRLRRASEEAEGIEQYDYI